MKTRFFPAVTAALVLATSSVMLAQDPPKIQMINYVGTIQGGLDAKKAKAGDAVNLKILNEAKLNDGTDVTKGSIIEGHIDSITPSENKSDSTAVITFDKISVGGKETPVRAWILNIGTGDSSGTLKLTRIDGLTTKYSTEESNSGTVTQEKKNLKLSGSTQIVVTLAVIPAGVVLQQ